MAILIFDLFLNHNSQLKIFCFLNATSIDYSNFQNPYNGIKKGQLGQGLILQTLSKFVIHFKFSKTKMHLKIFGIPFAFPHTSLSQRECVWICPCLSLFTIISHLFCPTLGHELKVKVVIISRISFIDLFKLILL